MHSIVVIIGVYLLNCAFALPAPAMEDSTFTPKNKIKYDGSADWSRVVGGANASTGQFPYIASLRRSNNHFCGAAIVSKFYLLSAAHCTVGVSASSLTAVVGTTTLNSGGTNYLLDNILNHPNFTSFTIENDVSILRTASAIIGSSLVASIPIGSANVGAGVTATLSGWGRTSDTGTSLPNNLQFLDLRTIDNNECAQLNGQDLIFPSSLCAITEVGQGACTSDSGGPLVANGILIGIVSWTYYCASGLPDVFARVSYYVPWIQENTT